MHSKAKISWGLVEGSWCCISMEMYRYESHAQKCLSLTKCKKTKRFVAKLLCFSVSVGRLRKFLILSLFVVVFATICSGIFYPVKVDYVLIQVAPTPFKIVVVCIAYASTKPSASVLVE